MSPEDLKGTTSAKYVAAGKLNNYRIAFTRYAHFRKGGVADVVYSPGDNVEGVLLDVPTFRRLDAREGHPYVYYRTHVKVINMVTGEPMLASTYRVLDPLNFEVKPSVEYEDLMVSSAERFLSSEYVASLKSKISSLEPLKVSQKNRLTLF